MNKQAIERLRKQIGEYVKELRVEKGLSYYAVSQTCHLAHARIEAIEKGMGYSIDTFLKVIIALDCNLVIESKGLEPTGMINGKNMDIDKIRIAIGKYLKQLRIKNKLTYYAVAKKVGITQLHIEPIENGDGYTINSFIKLTSALDCTFSLEEREEK